MNGMRAYSEKERAWLWLNSVVGANVRLAENLLWYNDGLLSLYNEARRGNFRAPENMSTAQRKLLVRNASDAAVDDMIVRLEKTGAFAVTRDSADYPSLLREIYDPPTVLYVKGRIFADIRLPIAVIGSRKCSSYGKEIAEYFGRRLAENGACVVSGLAVGCDSIAANAALRVSSNDYPTIAVLGSGIDVVYPVQSRELYEGIAKVGGVISEYAPGKPPARENFPQRNRIISGLSKGVLVVEAGQKSGTRITAEFALEQGRDVFAVPGRINDLLSVGTNGLIKSGEAKAVFDVDDILYEYGSFMISAETPVRAADTSKLSFEQRKIYEALRLGEKNIDELCESTDFSVSELNMYLTEMELSGIIKQLPNGEFAV